MSDIIEYKHKGKCLYCKEPLWVVNDNDVVTCKCGSAKIDNGIKDNCVELSESDLIFYLKEGLNIVATLKDLNKT